MTDESSGGGLMDRFRASMAEERRKTVGELREILLRAERPRDGDVQRLGDLLEILELSPGDVTEYIELVQSIARSEKLVALEVQRKAARSQANTARTLFDQEIEAKRAAFEKKAADDRGKLEKALQAATDDYQEVRKAVSELRDFQARWRALEENLPIEQARKLNSESNATQAP